MARGRGDYYDATISRADALELQTVTRWYRQTGQTLNPIRRAIARARIAWRPARDWEKREGVSGDTETDEWSIPAGVEQALLVLGGGGGGGAGESQGDGAGPGPYVFGTGGGAGQSGAVIWAYLESVYDGAAYYPLDASPILVTIGAGGAGGTEGVGSRTSGSYTPATAGTAGTATTAANTGSQINVQAAGGAGGQIDGRGGQGVTAVSSTGLNAATHTHQNGQPGNNATGGFARGHGYNWYSVGAATARFVAWNDDDPAAAGRADPGHGGFGQGRGKRARPTWEELDGVAGFAALYY